MLTAKAVETFSAVVSHDGSGGKAALMCAGTADRTGKVTLAQSPIVQFCFPATDGLQSAFVNVLMRLVMRPSRIREGPSAEWMASSRRNELEIGRAHV